MPSSIARPKPPKVRVPQRKRGVERVSALKAAATVLFLERGFDATTMTEIAAQAGASIGALYLYFPTKVALAQAMLIDFADELSVRLDAIGETVDNQTAAEIAGRVFDVLSGFMAEHPVYSVLLEQRGDDAWRQAMRSRRRVQVQALFEKAEPRLPEGMAKRLALMIPQLMRTGIIVPDRSEARAIIADLRAMLHLYLKSLEAGQ